MVLEEIIRYSPRRRASPWLAEGLSPTARTYTGFNSQSPLARRQEAHTGFNSQSSSDPRQGAHIGFYSYISYISPAARGAYRFLFFFTSLPETCSTINQTAMRPNNGGCYDQRNAWRRTSAPISNTPVPSESRINQGNSLPDVAGSCAGAAVPVLIWKRKRPVSL
jgi:hypothetical protein